MTEPAQPGRVCLQYLEDRVGIGRNLALEHDFPFLVDHADRGLFHRNVESGKVFHGCPPLALGARTRPRISTVILGTATPRAAIAAYSASSPITRAISRS